MSTPKRIQRTKGLPIPKGSVYVGKPTLWGNPFAPKVIPGWATMSREYAVEDYERWLFHWHGGRRMSGPSGGVICWCLEHGDRARVLDGLATLAGKDLACWCPTSQPCHADVLLRLANGGQR